MANFMSLEMCEHRFPLRFDYFALRENSGGAGWHRGGCGTSYGFTAWSECVVSVLGDRVDYAPFGVQGGGPASPSHVEFETQGKKWIPHFRSKEEKQLLKPGDSLRAASPGGGGFGDPLERDLDSVQLDLNRGYINESSALEKYGVVIAPAPDSAGDAEGAGHRTYRLDRQASATKRAALLDKRKHSLNELKNQFSNPRAKASQASAQS